MLKFLTGLSFLYILAITVLLLYGWIYYRDFKRHRHQQRRFPIIIFIISAACISFLWINIHAPLRLQTFSNLDHHFIQHDGFVIPKSIELGRSDTTNYENNSYNRFLFTKKEGIVNVSSSYSEEPFYISGENGYRILSVTYPAIGHTISLQCAGININISAATDNWFELRIKDDVYKKEMPVKKGTTCWNIFREDDAFIQSAYYNHEKLIAGLKNILLLRDDVSKKEAGELKYFISGRLFNYVNKVKYDEQGLLPDSQRFNAPLGDSSSFAWGIGFLVNNRNQFRVKYGGSDTFALINRYPVSYPLTEENRDDWDPHCVRKFLLSDTKDMHQIPGVLKEGFLFSFFSGDEACNFSPLLLTYQKSGKNEPLQLRANLLVNRKKDIEINDSKLSLPSKNASFNWAFSIRNTFNWDFDGRVLAYNSWQLLIFGSLLFFFLLVFFTSLVRTPASQGWVWQLLSCITIVLLTTRFFLYWRYKSFPPYEGMDLPSQQQLQSFSNFGIIIFATILLAIIFGFGSLKYLYGFLRKAIAKLSNKSFNSNPQDTDFVTRQLKRTKRLALFQRIDRRVLFFISWILVLLTCGIIAGLNHFDPGICRHLAILLAIAWFVFLFISYNYSPLTQSAEKSWWKISTGNFFNIVISNPVKILLSVSLLALFVFIDIGFAIVFLNFLFFNEAFLCINYGIAGLSAGSKRNAGYFGVLGILYLIFFVLNLFYAPYIFKFLLDMPQSLYLVGYLLFSAGMAYLIVRMVPYYKGLKKMTIGFATAIILFGITFYFFPKERIIDKASMTKYRIDVLTTPVDQSIILAYKEGNTYEPVIRAAQNQWFINTFIYEGNNPGVRSAGFNLLPHAPQNKGAKYNAQATDLVTSRFLIAEHGQWSVLLYVMLLLLPIIMLSSFYKLYPDFTNRTNTNYPIITIGFSILNYLLITALLVILAATGRYIFFGQDLPFGSILSKQSIMVPCIIILAVVYLFKNIPLEQYSNRKKIIPASIVFVFLFMLLFFFKPPFNKNKEFGVENLAKDMDTYIQLRLQPILDHFDTASNTKNLSLKKKDELFTDSIQKMLSGDMVNDDNNFFIAEINAYARSGFARHLDQRHMLYLDLYSGRPQLAVNENYFRVEPPPHLQQLWTGNVFGDTSAYNVSVWNAKDGSVVTKRLSVSGELARFEINDELGLFFDAATEKQFPTQLFLINRSKSGLQLKYDGGSTTFYPGESFKLGNPCRISITDFLSQTEQVLTVEPDAFMRNYYVNGSRFYMYPMKDNFIWARNFAEAIATEYTTAGNTKRDAFVSFDFELMDSLSAKIQGMMARDTAYKRGAEYAICIADGNGRIIALSDYIKGFTRPDPNDKAAFNKVIQGEDGFVSQSLLRKQIGNINLLRLNPGPGSTFKPIVFSAIASQLDWNWDGFAAEGFAEKQNYYGGEKVPEYDFEKNNGRISRVSDYLKYSDNYYHSNVLLLGSYPKQDPSIILSDHFMDKKPGSGLHWPYFTYAGKQYWLNGFQNWPGYLKGKANFGSDSSFITIGLLNNYNIYTNPVRKSYDTFTSTYDSMLFLNGYQRSGFILPEYSLFDQQGGNVDHRIPYDVFTTCFRGHVKGSSQVLVSPAKMLEAIGRLVSQSRNYGLTFNPYAEPRSFLAFDVDKSILYNNYLSVMRENVFAGMREALYSGTAARLGTMLKDGAPYYYYAKTGTTGDDEVKTKSKLLSVVISSKDLTDPDFNFRNNKFYTIYFTSQNGPVKQNEEFQAEVIRWLQQSSVFNRYMQETK